MEWVSLGARVLLALVFALAAVSKLLDQQGTRQTLKEFHVRERLQRPAALALPLAELVVAVALLLTPLARFAAAGAIVLLTLFAVGILTAMARGEAPDCHCFGQLNSAPAGRGTLLRNAVIAVPAVLVLGFGSGKSLDGWLTSSSGASLVAAVGVLAAAALAAVSARLWLDRKALSDEAAQLRRSLDLFPPGLPIGVRAPRFEAHGVDGDAVTLDDLLALGKPVALAFVSPDCGPCAAMLEDIGRWQATLSDRLTIALPARGTPAGLRDFTQGLGLRNVLADDGGKIFDAYRIEGTPSVVIVTAQGRIGSDTRATHAIMEELIRRELAKPPDSAEEEPAPMLHVVHTPGLSSGMAIAAD